MNCAAAANGYGKPILSIPPAKIPEALKFSNFGILTNGVAMGTMKMSIGFSMLRIQLARPFTIVVWITMVLSVLVNLNVLVGCFKSCTPMERIWNLAVPGTCWPTEVNVALAYLQSSEFSCLSLINAPSLTCASRKYCHRPSSYLRSLDLSYQIEAIHIQQVGFAGCLPHWFSVSLLLGILRLLKGSRFAGPPLVLSSNSPNFRL